MEEFDNYDWLFILADEELLAQDWLSEGDNQAGMYL